MVNLGFIGFGRMGLTHFSILNSNPAVKIQSVCDASGSMLSLLKSHVPVRTYTDPEKMLANEKLDAVVVSTPSDSHAKLVRLAVRHDLHVFTEKPFVLSVAQGREILSELEGKSLVNQVGYVNRFNEIFQEIKGLVSDGVIGEVKSFSSEMFAPTVLKDTKGSWRSVRHAGGGCLYELGCHCIDLGVYLFGQPDRVAGSVMMNVFSSDVDDMVSSTLVYGNHFGLIHVNWCDESFRKPANVIRVFGNQGKIIADKHGYRLFLKKERPDLGLRKGWNARNITQCAQNVRFYLRGNEFTRQLDYFVDCIENRNFQNVSSFEEALKTDIVIEQIIGDSYGKGPSAPHASAAVQALQGPGEQRPTPFSFFSKLWK